MRRSEGRPLHPRRTRWLAAVLGVLGLAVLPTAALANHLFADVAHGHPHEAGIGYLTDAGITVGCATNPDRFCPNDDLTRAQMGSFIYRQSGHDPATPPSVNAASLAEVEVVTDDVTINGSAVNTASVSCPTGMAATGGGSQTTAPQGWHLSFSRPTNDGTGWTAQHVQKDGNLGINTTTVWAVCVRVGGS